MEFKKTMCRKCRKLFITKGNPTWKMCRDCRASYRLKPAPNFASVQNKTVSRLTGKGKQYGFNISS